MKATPYLGVVSSAAPAALAAQIGLGEGFGLVVDEVLPESPALAAGVQRYDVLKQLNEQQLVDPAQLGTLVRSLGKDTEITLTLIRKGQEQKITLKIGEKMLPERRSEEMRGGSFSPPDSRRGGDGEMPKPPQGPMDTPARQRPGGGADASERSLHPADMLRDMRPGTTAQGRAEWSEGASRWDSTRARVVIRDHEGQVELGMKDGHRTLTVKNSAGETVFTGPVETPEQRNAVPEPHRAKLAELEVAPPPRRTGADAEPRHFELSPSRQRTGGIQ